MFGKQVKSGKGWPQGISSSWEQGRGGTRNGADCWVKNGQMVAREREPSRGVLSGLLGAQTRGGRAGRGMM